MSNLLQVFQACVEGRPENTMSPNVSGYTKLVGCIMPRRAQPAQFGRGESASIKIQNALSTNRI